MVAHIACVMDEGRGVVVEKFQSDCENGSEKVLGKDAVKGVRKCGAKGGKKSAKVESLRGKEHAKMELFRPVVSEPFLQPYPSGALEVHHVCPHREGRSPTCLPQRVEDHGLLCASTASQPHAIPLALPRYSSETLFRLAGGAVISPLHLSHLVGRSCVDGPKHQRPHGDSGIELRGQPEDPA
jgi:hypothetical protein